MRVDPAFTELLAKLREPRFVVGIIYPVSSPYFTNKTGIANVPGVNVNGVVQGISGTTQRLVPVEGRATIGTLTITLVDDASAVTDEIRSQLDSGEGIKGREVRVYTGDTDDFDDFTRIETYIVDGVDHDKGLYRIRCSDRKREMRKALFEPKKTRLNATLTAVATTVTVLDTTDFSTIVHTAAFTDAPSSTVGYFRVKKTKEVIRYTGKTATTFTGCTRERFGTLAQAITVDGATPDDKLPEIEEVIYLEMPCAQLLHSVMTGTIYKTANPLPAHWSLGLAVADVVDSDYDAIGLDLFDPADVTVGLIMRFVGLTKTDGKRWCEKELLLAMSAFMPIGADGALGLRRLPRVLTDAPYSFQLDESNVVSHSSLKHNLGVMANTVRIDWNHNGDDFTRTTLTIDAPSVSAHGDQPPRVFKFKGLTASRNTDQVIAGIAQAYLNRAAEPPEELTVTCLPSTNNLQVGDVVRVKLPGLRDFADTGTLDRSFLIEERFFDWIQGKARFKLFGSSREVASVPPATGTPIPNGWYDDLGTELSTVLTIVADAVTANGTLTGGADVNAAGATFYYLGNLTIDAGVTVTTVDNVVLRIRGFLTINGKIDGKGVGLAGSVDPVTTPFSTAGTIGFLGTTQGQGGAYQAGALLKASFAPNAIGEHDAFPFLNLRLADTATTPILHGLPGDLRGTSGGHGMGLYTSPPNVSIGAGANGGAGGGGLAVICRGMGFGVSGEIDLSGNDGAVPGASTVLNGVTLFPGAGGGGSAGGLFIGLDGDGLSLPDLSGKFTANRGATIPQGTLGNFQDIPAHVAFPTQPGSSPYIGLTSQDMFNSASRIQYVPSDEIPGDSDDEVVPPPTSLTATAGGAGVLLSWVNPPPDKFNYIEVFESITNNRSSAVAIGNVTTDEATRLSDTVITRFYWVRSRHQLFGPSVFEPLSATAGVQVTFGGLPAGSLVGTVNLDTQVSGTLAVGNAEAGLLNTSVTIGADATLSGAGGGTPSLASIGGLVGLTTQVSGLLPTGNAASGLVNTSITINAVGTLGGAGGGQANLASLPGLVGLSSAVGGLVNTNITINANATLSGAGSGTPSLASIGGLVGLTSQVSGLLPTGNAASGLVNTNITINAVGTLGGAGSGQANLASLPGLVGLGSAVAGLVNTSITINATGTLGGAGSGQANLANLPGLVGTGSAVAALVNVNVTINATGTLSGAGGGQANLASLPGLVAVASAVGGLINTSITINDAGALAGAGGGQARLALLKTKAADQTVNNSASLVDDTHLAGFSLQADTWYSIAMYLQFFPSTGMTTANMRWGLTFSQTPQESGGALTFQSGAMTNQIQFKKFDGGVKTALGAINAESAMTASGTFRTNATTGGTLKLQWAQHLAAAADLIMRKGSHILLVPLT